MTPSGVYVYAIVPADQRAPAGMGGVGTPPMPLRVLREGPLGAFISDVPLKLRPRRRDLIAHQDLLFRLIESGPVLPMRFGMVAPDEATLRRQLAGAEERYLSALEQVTDRVEVNVKALPPTDALAALVREDKGIQKLRDDARRHPGYETNVRLGEAVATALSRRASEAGRLAVVKLTPLAQAVAAGPDVSGCVLNTSFLVDGPAAGRFREVAEQFAALHRDRVDLRVIGPLPCYSFVAPEASLVRAGV